MSTISCRTYSEENVHDALNAGKDALLYLLVKDGVLTEKQAEVYIRDYHVMVEQPGWISRTWKKLFPINDEKQMIIIVKQVSLDVPKSDDENTKP